MLRPSQALRRWQVALRQPQGAAGGGAPAGGGQSMRTGHGAATTCSRHVCFAAMQAANGQSWAETDRCREAITEVIAAGWRCNASSKWAVSGRDRQVQRSNHGSDCSWLALQCKQQMGSLGQTDRRREAIMS